MAGILKLGQTEIAPGEIREVHIPITEAANSLPILAPVTVLRGQKPGPRVFLTAAVHGNELNGTAILRALLNKISVADLRGSLLVAPIVNMQGFLARSRYLPDRRDLNRNFPGKPSGSTAQRMAYRLFHEIISKCDMGIDFHTAAEGRDNYPHIRADMKNASARRMAKAFGSPIIIHSPGVKGTLRYAAIQKNIPTLLFEGGTPNTFQTPVVASGLKSLLHFLSSYGMVPPTGEPRSPFQIIVKRSHWIRAERGGLLELKVAPGTLVHRGDPVAIISNPLGREVHAIITPLTGLVIGLTTSPVVNPGTPIVHLVELRKTLKTVTKYLKDQRLPLG